MKTTPAFEPKPAFGPEAVSSMYNYTLANIKASDTVGATRRRIDKGCGCYWSDESGWMIDCPFHFGYEQAVDDVMNMLGEDDVYADGEYV